MQKIPVGISACLLGQEVRYDGGHKHSPYCTKVLANYFEFLPLCPELQAGLGVPRPTIHLEQQEDELRLVDVKGNADHTDAMHDWIGQTLDGLSHLRGYILMAKSPSCGMERIRIYDPKGQVLHRDGRGMFAAALMQRFPLLPVEEEGRLNDSHLRENFIERVFVYDEWMRLEAEGLTSAALVAFHTRHKFQLKAHCENTYRHLGQKIANLKAAPIGLIAEQYISQFMQAMARQIRRGSHAHVMQSMMGYLREVLEPAEKQMLLEQIEAYRREEIPLIVPMTLLRMAQRRQPAAYLENQGYLSPYPDALGLRNRV